MPPHPHPFRPIAIYAFFFFFCARPIQSKPTKRYLIRRGREQDPNSTPEAELLATSLALKMEAIEVAALWEPVGDLLGAAVGGAGVGRGDEEGRHVVAAEAAAAEREREADSFSRGSCGRRAKEGWLAGWLT